MSSAPWLTETIRFSAFGDTPAYKSSLLLDLFGVQPDQVNERPAQSFRQEVARHGRFRIIATRNPGQLDVVFADLADANVSDPTKSDYKPFLEIGDYDEIFPTIQPLIRRLLPDLKRCTQLAYAPTLLASARTQEDANRLLASKLPHVSFDPTQDTDVAWQINRPRASTNLSFRLNRVSKWHTMSVQLLRVFPPIARMLPSHDAVAARVELDVNTPADRSDALEAIDLAAIFDELASLACELIEKGDIP